MQLHDYFQHQHQYHLSDQEKADIFHRINQKRLEQSTARRHFSYKKISYTFIVSVIVLLTFGGFRMEKYGGIDNLFFSSNPTNPTDVYADYIAEIIEFNGEYTLTNGEKSLTSPYIHNGDTINLKAGAEMLFTLTDKSQAKIIGPASLSITKDSNHNYTIYLIAGNFFKIFNETWDTNIEIIADDISIHSNKHQPLDLQIAKEGKEMLIKNNGGEIKITTSPNQENTTKQEKTITKELVSIKNNDINVLTDTKMFTNFLTRNNISETLSLTTQPQTLLPNTNEENTSLASNTSAPSRQTSSGETATGNFPERSQIFESTTGQQTNDTINEEIKSDLGLGHETKIPTPTQNELLKTTVNSFFLTNNFEKIYNSLLENDETKLKENSKNLATKLNALAKSFAIETSTSTELTDLASFALEIKTTLETIYYIAPSDLSQLEKIAHRCEYLTNLSPETALSRSDFTNQLPASLQLK